MSIRELGPGPPGPATLAVMPEPDPDERFVIEDALRGLSQRARDDAAAEQPAQKDRVKNRRTATRSLSSLS